MLITHTNFYIYITHKFGTHSKTWFCYFFILPKGEKKISFRFLLVYVVNSGNKKKQVDL